ncbi:MAG: helix-turn-helix domain-containing protein [Anaerolineales bacterium]|nr:helix-turn-helix domain-containing protein [Anaerolineales bacterium]
MNVIPLYRFRYADENIFPFEIARFEDKLIATAAQQPRRDMFFNIFWIAAGIGEYYIDFTHYNIRPNTLFCIGPGQIHYCKTEKPIKGYALFFEEELFHITGLNAFFEKVDLFKTFGNESAIYFSDQAAQYINQLVSGLFIEYSHEQFGRVDAIVARLQLLLIQAQRNKTNAHSLPPRNASDQLTRHFLKLVEQHISTVHNLHDYAQWLDVTVGHLTETVKAETGFPAGVLLRKRLLLEAKRWLAYSDLTAAQVASKLQFDDPSYFGRFFKRETGQTPNTFRAEFGKTSSPS